MKDLETIICRMAEKIEELEQRVDVLEAKCNDEKHLFLPRNILPVKLKLSVQKFAELNNLVQEGYIVPDGEHLIWNDGNVTLLAFVCGRLWAGDRRVKDKIKKGKGEFPASSLERLFRVSNLKQSRYNIFLRNSESLTKREQEVYDIMTSV